MGSLKSVLSMLPGMEKQLRDVDVDDRQMLRVEAIIQSMTAKERRKPEITSRRRVLQKPRHKPEERAVFVPAQKCD